MHSGKSKLGSQFGDDDHIRACLKTAEKTRRESVIGRISRTCILVSSGDGGD